MGRKITTSSQSFAVCWTDIMKCKKLFFFPVHFAHVHMFQSVWTGRKMPLLHSHLQCADQEQKGNQHLCKISTSSQSEITGRSLHGENNRKNYVQLFYKFSVSLFSLKVRTKSEHAPLLTVHPRYWRQEPIVQPSSMNWFMCCFRASLYRMTADKNIYSQEKYQT